ncbi:MAG: hypothetical protein K0U74_02605 [Alphaproteobacteria bacterium]|nr:hypothetical protein [Alphaproteobacteria bacterium]
MMNHPVFKKAMGYAKRLSQMRLDLRLILSAFCAMGILHIVATLAAPAMMGRSAYDRLSSLLPINEMIVLQPITPEFQPLPFLTPDVRYAMCRYDTADAPVIVMAELPGRGWSLALHSPNGDNVYAATGQDERVTRLRLRIMPTNDRFMGLTPEALGISDTSEKPQIVRSARGIVVVRAPDRGRAYSPFIERDLYRVQCYSETTQ